METDVQDVDERLARLRSRIGELPSEENPFVELADGRSAAGLPQGELYGVPVAVKDVIAVAGTRMRLGTSFMSIESHEDAGVVAMLRAAGASIVGTTRTHELASGTTGLNPNDPDGGLRNPWDSARVGGGSSVGSAVSVATGLTPIALGTDTGGSVRAPASLCGVFGFKPSYGLVPMHGVYPVASTMDHVGILASWIDHLIGAASALLPPDERTPTASPVRSVAVLESDIRDLDDEVHQAFQAQIDAWERRGLTVDVVPFSSPDHIYDVSGTILLYESSRNLGPLLDEHGERISAPVRDRLVQGRDITTREYAEALAERRLLISSFRRVFNDHDLVAGPTVPIRPPLVEKAGDPRLTSRIVRNTRLGNVTGAPAISVPFRHGEAQIGVQYTALPGGDWRLLHAVRSIADANDSRR